MLTWLSFFCCNGDSLKQLCSWGLLLCFLARGWFLALGVGTAAKQRSSPLPLLYPSPYTFIHGATLDDNYLPKATSYPTWNIIYGINPIQQAVFICVHAGLMNQNKPELASIIKTAILVINIWFDVRQVKANITHHYDNFQSFLWSRKIIYFIIVYPIQEDSPLVFFSPKS